MTEHEWLEGKDPGPMLAFLRGKASDRKLRLFAVACCRTVWELLPDESTRRAVQVAELMADGHADPTEQRRIVEEIGPKVNTQYGIFLCGGCSGPGSTYAAMAATAALDPAQTFTSYMGQTPSETHTAWECVARAQAQTAKEDAREKRWHERDESARDGEHEPDDAWYEQTEDAAYDAWDRERAAAWAAHCALLRDIFGNPFRPVAINPSYLRWRDGTVVRIVQAIYHERRFQDLPILADTLEEAGCTDAAILTHCRGPGEHVRGCWVVDAILAKK
jgi:hypothetical protein